MQLTRYISLVLIIALTVTVSAPFYSFTPAALAGNGLAGNKILICTADGLKLLNLKDGTTEDVPDGQNVPHCPLCIISSGDGFSAPDDGAEIEILQQLALASYSSSYNTQSSFRLDYSSTPRAPPGNSLKT